jgi:hypothetical protein
VGVIAVRLAGDPRDRFEQAHALLARGVVALQENQRFEIDRRFHHVLQCAIAALR